MLLLLLAALSGSDVLELSRENIYDYVGLEVPIFVKFFMPHCANCQAVRQDFEDASNLFTDVTFAEVDCAVDRDLCQSFNTSNYPSFKLFVLGDTFGIFFRGAKESHYFADFIEHHTLCRSSRPPSKVLALDPLTIGKITGGCGFTLFYTNYVDLSQSFAYSMRTLADLYEFDDNIQMATWNCAKFPDVCAQANATEFPAVSVHHSGRWTRYPGSHLIEEMTDFLNERCKTERMPSGMLSDKAGTVPQGDALAAEFLEASDRAAVIAKTKAVPGAELYVKAMERFVEKGHEQIAKDLEAMVAHIQKRTGSIRALDSVKKRLNVFRRFVPVTEKPVEDVPEPQAEDQPL
jgi:thiol-disulfide isomerase/thioredoxin